MSQFSIAPQSEEKAQNQANYDPLKYEQFMRDIRQNQNLPLAVIGGFAASVIAAVLWALITYLTNFQIGFMAIGVGIVVGYAVKVLGKGITTPFGIVGAIFALIGCLLGNLLTAVIAGSMEEGSSFSYVLSALMSSPGIILEVYKATFSPIDLLFYAIAIYEGFKISFRQITEEEMTYLQKTPAPMQNQNEVNLT